MKSILVTGGSGFIGANFVPYFVEKYPDLKSQKNYQQAMTEFSVTDNRVADYQEAYNNSINSYNSYVRSFPANVFLNLTGYSIQKFSQTNIKVNDNQARNLFDK